MLDAKKTKSAAAQATDEQPVAPPYLREISVHPAFYSSGQKMIVIGRISLWIAFALCPLAHKKNEQRRAAPYGKI